MADPSNPQIGPDHVCAWQLRDVEPGRPALFLDRDGVIVEEVNYLHRVDDVQLIDGAAQLIAAANEAGAPVIVVTNQAGIGRGYYGWKQFAAVEHRIADLLAQKGAQLDAVFACPFHADGVAPYDVADHPDRKPMPGMLLRAEKLLGVELARSWMIGDTAADVGAAVTAGLAGCIHVLAGHGERDRDAVLEIDPGATELRCVPDLQSIGPVAQLFNLPSQ